MRHEEYLEYLKSEAWKVRRKWKLDQAGNRCQVCNAGGELHVHHRTYERVGEERDNDLTVLCEMCHTIFHDRIPKPPEPKPAAPTRDPKARRFADWWERYPKQSEFTSLREAFAYWSEPFNLTSDESAELYTAVSAELRERGLL